MSELLCPYCKYDLTEIEPVNELRRCPECGEQSRWGVIVLPWWFSHPWRFGGVVCAFGFVFGVAYLPLQLVFGPGPWLFFGGLVFAVLCAMACLFVLGIRLRDRIGRAFNTRGRMAVLVAIALAGAPVGWLLGVGTLVIAYILMSTRL